MNAEKLLKTLPQLQNQLDALVDFEVRECIAGRLFNKDLNSKLYFSDLIEMKV